MLDKFRMVILRVRSVAVCVGRGYWRGTRLLMWNAAIDVGACCTRPFFTRGDAMRRPWAGFIPPLLWRWA